MSKTKLIATSAITGVLMAGAFAAPAFAWQPKGVIKKYVQNQTAASQMADANDAASAVSVKTGDTLKYTIVVENIASADSRGHNDMYFTKMADTLPVGVELVSDASKRAISEDLGIIKPGQKVTREYVVKVTSATDKDLIDNKACFTGDSQVKDNHQEGCDNAEVVVSVPPKQDQPKPEVKAEATVLPSTGPTDVFATAGAVSVLGYLGNLLRLKRNKR